MPLPTVPEAGKTKPFKKKYITYYKVTRGSNSFSLTSLDELSTRTIVDNIYRRTMQHDNHKGLKVGTSLLIWKNYLWFLHLSVSISPRWQALVSYYFSHRPESRFFHHTTNLLPLVNLKTSFVNQHLMGTHQYGTSVIRRCKALQTESETN